MLMDWENIAKMSSLNEEIYRFNAIPFKIPKVHFTELEQIQNLYRTSPYTHTQRISKTILMSKNKAEGIMIPDLKLYYKATVMKQYGTGTKRYMKHISGTELRTKNKSTHIRTINL